MQQREFVIALTALALIAACVTVTRTVWSVATSGDHDRPAQQPHRAYPTQTAWALRGGVSPPRVAICLAGGVRTMRLTMEELAVNLVDSLQPDVAYRQVFLELTTSHDCLSNLNNKALLDDCLRQFNKTTAWLGDTAGLLKLLGGSNVTTHVENELRCRHPFLVEHPCCVKDRRAMNDNGEGLLGMAQYMRRRLCYQRVLDHEKATGDRFDFVVLTRPDLAFLEPVPPAAYFLSRPPRLYFMTKGDAWADYLFMSPRELSDDLDRVFDEANTKRCAGTAPRDASPEYVMGPWVEAYMPHQLFPFQAAIVRSSNRGDCGRLDISSGNDINSAARVLNSSHALVPYSAICTARYPLGIAPVARSTVDATSVLITIAAVVSVAIVSGVELLRRYRRKARHHKHTTDVEIR